MFPTRRFHTLVILAAVWCLLSGYYTGLLLGLGALSSMVALLVYSRMRHSTSYTRLVFSPVRQLSYLSWLIVEIVKSNIDVMLSIFDRKRQSPEFFYVSTGDLDETGQVIYANSITLTPGTVSTKIGARRIQVHGLTVASKQALADEGMKTRVEALVDPENSGPENSGKV